MCSGDMASDKSGVLFLQSKVSMPLIFLQLSEVFRGEGDRKYKTVAMSYIYPSYIGLIGVVGNIYLFLCLL